MPSYKLNPHSNKDHGANKDKQAVEQAIQSVTSTENALNGDANLQRAKLKLHKLSIT